jgi:predicted DCC family thiol-disulfide oxidoreductase YuxK
MGRHGRAGDDDPDTYDDDDRPPAGADGRLVFLFDGECGLCNAGVDFVLRHERRPDTVFAAQQSDAGRRLLAAHGVAALAGKTVVVIADGRPLTRSAAVLRLARQLRWPWRSAAAVRLVPPPVRDWAYDVVASHRYQWFGRRDACRMPTPGSGSASCDPRPGGSRAGRARPSAAAQPVRPRRPTGTPAEGSGQHFASTMKYEMVRRCMGCGTPLPVGRARGKPHGQRSTAAHGTRSGGATRSCARL